MRTLFLSPDYHCNEKCAFCPCTLDARQYTSLKIGELHNAIDRAIDEENIEMVLISGGEPTIYKDILPLIKYIKSKNLRLGILSNSLMFSNSQYVDKFIDIAGVDFELTTAFHSHISSQHDMITSVQNSFEKSMSGVNNLISKGVRVTIKHIINNVTYKELPDYTDWLYETFPDNVAWVICNIDICGAALQNEDMSATPFNVSKPYLESALDRVLDYRQKERYRDISIFNTPLCCIDPYYWSFLRKYKSEEEMAGLYIPYEKEEDNYISFNLKGDGGANFGPCEKCILQPQCPGTWKKTAEVYGEQIFKPFR